jgi:1,4-dihydroxy-2-naphthoate polyprenyltransferase
MAKTIDSLDAWNMALRPKALTASMAPVIVGSAAAYGDGGFTLWPAFCALMCSLLLQAGVNLANDYFDTQGNHDLTHRKGPMLGMQTGLIAPAKMKAALTLIFGLCMLFGIPLIMIGGWPILIIGTAAILVAILYAGGPYPLGGYGLGDIVVFLFFGFAGVCGTYYVQTLNLSWLPVIAAIPVGLLVTSILVVNNIRDIESDAHIGKKTLAVMLGEKRSRWECMLLVVLPYLIPFMLLAMYQSLWSLLPLATIPKAARVVRIVLNESGPALSQCLMYSAHLALIYSLFLSAGIILAK